MNSLVEVGSTDLNASRKSSEVTMTSVSSGRVGFSSTSYLILGTILRRAAMPASLHRAERSAPTYPWVISPRRSRSTSSARGIFREWILRIWVRPCLLGTPMVISRSKRPGLLRAGSTSSGMLVAPMMTTSPRETRPSMRARSWATTRFSTSPMTWALLGARASISSRKMMAGAFLLASSKTILSLASLSP